jgi:2-polyprenyl-6-methoxyphenol hydroxylase-like FAD-dependent oxidoreductase
MPTHPNFGRIIARPALHKALMDALEAENVSIRCEAKVCRYWETDSEGGVELTNGEIIRADLVVAADGIHSKSWTLVSGVEPEIYPSGLAMFRAAFPLDHAMANPILREKWMPSDSADKMGFFLSGKSFGIVMFGQNKASWVWQHNENRVLGSYTFARRCSSAARQRRPMGRRSPCYHRIDATEPHR